MTKEEFYEECAKLLGTQYEYVNVITNTRRTNRWGPRQPGNGRFPGIGLIRWFSPTCIHVAITGFNGVLKSPEEVFEILKC